MKETVDSGFSVWPLKRLWKRLLTCFSVSLGAWQGLHVTGENASVL